MLAAFEKTLVVVAGGVVLAAAYVAFLLFLGKLLARASGRGDEP